MRPLGRAQRGADGSARVLPPRSAVHGTSLRPKWQRARATSALRNHTGGNQQRRAKLTAGANNQPDYGSEMRRSTAARARSAGSL